MKRKMTIGLIVLALALATLLYIEHDRLGKVRAEARAAKEKLAELEKENHALDVRIRMYIKMAGDLERKLAELGKEKAQVMARLRESESRLKALRGQVEAMPPDDLVQETRRILKDSGVEKIDVGARFSLAAFRKNTAILKEWEEFSLTKIPALETQVRILEKETTNLQNQVLLWKEADRLWRQKNTLWLEEKMVMNGLIINYEKQISSRKRQRWYFFILGALAGAGGHALLK